MSSMLEKLNQMKEEEKEQQVPQMSIGQQLEIMSKVKEIEYQNSLVMMSLEKYNEKFEKLKIEQTELLELINQKVKSLEDNNQIFSKTMSQEIEKINQIISEQLKSQNQKSEKIIGGLIDKSSKVFDNFNNKIISTCENKIEQITNETTNAIKSCEDIKVNAKKRFDSYYNRKKIIDYLIYINLAITPILFIVLSWVLLKK